MTNRAVSLRISGNPTIYVIEEIDEHTVSIYEQEDPHYMFPAYKTPLTISQKDWDYYVALARIVGFEAVKHYYIAQVNTLKWSYRSSLWFSPRRPGKSNYDELVNKLHFTNLSKEVALPNTVDDSIDAYNYAFRALASKNLKETN